MKTARSIGVLAAALAPLACDGTSPTVPLSQTTLAADAPVEMAMGVQQTSISGALAVTGVGAAEWIRQTPSGMCHVWDMPVSAQFQGDVQGPVVFHEQNKLLPCEGGRLVGSGPVEGELTWNGLTGPISGQWTANCKPDDSPAGRSCDGTMNLRGWGDLEGVQFHTKWGPGWWPFPWTGTVLWK